jgi:hypothetical protein
MRASAVENFEDEENKQGNFIGKLYGVAFRSNTHSLCSLAME